MKEIQKKRKYYYDINFVRSVAALAVVMVHVTAANYSLNGQSFNWLVKFMNQTSRFATPMFAIISGFLLYNQAINGKFFIKKFISSRFTKIVSPFIIWSIIYLWLKGVSFAEITDFKQFLYDFIFGKSYYHLYFISLVIQFYLIFPFIEKFKTKKSLLFLTILGFYVSFFSLYITLPQLDNAFFNSIIHERSFIFKWIFYFFAGGLLAIYWENIMAFVKKNKALVITIAIITVVFNTYEYYFQDIILSSTRPTNIFHVPIMFIVLGAFYHMLASYKKIQEVFVDIGDMSMGIYLVHPLIIYFIRNFYPILYERTRWLLVGYIITLIICILLVKLIHKLPFGNYIVIIAKKRK